MKEKTTIGMISYHDLKYLKHSLPALLDQDYSNFEVVVCDNNETTEISKWIQENYPKVKVVNAGGNVGFGRAHNYMIKHSDADFYLCINSDMTVPNDYLSNLAKEFLISDDIGCVTGKLISWSNFPKNPKEISTQKIDTAGLTLKPNMAVIDRGQGEFDKGQYDNATEVFGASGASPLYRIKALIDTQHSPGEYFDECFFMYKEDVDLAYRLRWAGWNTRYTPLAIAWHDRTVTKIKGMLAKIKERRKRAEYVRRNSFLNQLILCKKNKIGLSLITRLKMWRFLTKYFMFILVFDTAVLSEISTYWKLSAKINKNSKLMPRRVDGKEIEKWFGI